MALENPVEHDESGAPYREAIVANLTRSYTMFRAGQRVYVIAVHGGCMEQAQVLARSKGNGRWVEAYVRVHTLTNWRRGRCYEPTALQWHYFGWRGPVEDLLRMHTDSTQETT